MTQDLESFLSRTAIELPQPTLSPGTFLGPYQILSKLAAGAMGEVYRARDWRLQRDVAIKALPFEFADDAGMLARFGREATLLASLNHANIAVIHDVVQRNGAIYLVLELVEGATLDQRLLEGPLPAEKILRIAHQIALALESAHEKGIVHRDLKPANVMVTWDGTVKVLDFGLAKTFSRRLPGFHGPYLDAFPQTISQSGLTPGTPAYMSPEQARGDAIDFRSDIFSFGVMLYQMASGRRPFDGPSLPSVIAQLLEKEPVPIAEVCPDLPREFSRIIHRCLRKNPSERYARTTQLVSDLNDLQRSVGLESISKPVPAEIPNQAASRNPATWRTVAMLTILGATSLLLGRFRLPTRGHKG